MGGISVMTTECDVVHSRSGFDGVVAATVPTTGVDVIATHVGGNRLVAQLVLVVVAMGTVMVVVMAVTVVMMASGRSGSAPPS